MKDGGKYASIAVVATAAILAAGIKMCSVYGDRASVYDVDRQTADSVAINHYLDSIDKSSAEKDSIKAARRKAKEDRKNRTPRMRSMLDEPVPATLPTESDNR